MSCGQENASPASRQDRLSERLGYRFRDRSLLDRALSHRSLNVSARGKAGDNQRLEFLGDRVLGMLLAEMLYAGFPGEAEGSLALRQAHLASRPVLAQVARDIELGAAIELSAAEDASGGRNLDSALEDACEALIGALYLDGGIDAARRFIASHWRGLLDAESAAKDAKTALQEWAQGHGFPLPLYEIAERAGPDHAPHFTIRVRVGEHSATGQGSPKKRAEQEAAANLLSQMGQLA